MQNQNITQRTYATQTITQIVQTALKIVSNPNRLLRLQKNTQLHNVKATLTLHPIKVGHSYRYTSKEAHIFAIALYKHTLPTDDITATQALQNAEGELGLHLDTLTPLDKLSKENAILKQQLNKINLDVETFNNTLILLKKTTAEKNTLQQRVITLQSKLLQANTQINNLTLQNRNLIELQNTISKQIPHQLNQLTQLIKRSSKSSLSQPALHFGHTKNFKRYNNRKRSPQNR